MSKLPTFEEFIGQSVIGFIFIIIFAIIMYGILKFIELISITW